MRTLQDGIAVTRDARPGGAFALLCLNRSPGAGLPDVRAALDALWSRWAELRRGVLRGVSRPVDPEGLAVLVGFGPRLLADAGAGVPPELAAGRFLPPTGESTPVLAGSALCWAGDAVANPADCDVVVQLTADTEAAVSRAVVETWRQARADGAVRPAAVFQGFRRRDRRTWIGFHDGVANPDMRERLNLVQVPAGTAPDWLGGGTYLAFLRIGIRLDDWDALDPGRQELLVGRDRTTGAPLEVDPADPAAYRPADLAVPGDVFTPGNEDSRDPLPVDPDHASGLGRSHVHRARRHLTGRMLRQGYDFLEPAAGDQALRAGLNFVSFQASPAQLTTVLTGPGWLGRSAFGGPDGELSGLLEVRAAGVYAVPPMPLTGCPGADLLPLTAAAAAAVTG